MRRILRLERHGVPCFWMLLIFVINRSFIFQEVAEFSCLRSVLSPDFRATFLSHYYMVPLCYVSCIISKKILFHMACMASFSSLKCCHTCSCSKCYFVNENVIACLISYSILCNKSHEFCEIMGIKKNVGVYLFKFRAQQTRFEINVLAV